MLHLSEPPELSAEETTELHKWLKEKSVHPNSVEAGSGFDDMQPLMAVVDLRSLPKGAVSKYFNAPRKTGPINLLLP